jgi:uncharacterized protein YbjT (DUF2867 family)
MIAVMGATGHTGRKLTEILLQAGERVRALGRSQTRLAELERAGAEAWAGDAADAEFLNTAFRGADAVFALLPPDLRAADYRAAQDRVSTAITTALRDSGVRSVVVLSSLGAELAGGTGPIATSHDLEQRLTQLEHIDVLVLRPAYFFENFEESLDLITQQGIHANAVDPHVPVPMVATRDVANAAAEALRLRKWQGLVVRELLGPRDLTFAEVTRILGTRLGKPDLPYVRMSYDDLAATLVQTGLSSDVARTYVELVRALNEGIVRSIEGRSAANTTPTRFEEFAEELAGDFARTS